jgi:hypothetical protein
LGEIWSEKRDQHDGGKAYFGPFSSCPDTQQGKNQLKLTVPSAVIPCEHVLGVVGFQEAVATEMSQTTYVSLGGPGHQI